MKLGTKLGDFWNLPWIFGAAALLLLASKLTLGRVNTSWLPERKAVVHLLSVLLVGYVIAGLAVTALKVGLHMPRPSAALPAGTVHVLVAPESPFSFPSGHAAFAMLVAVVFWPRCRYWLRALLVAFTLWVGVSRVSLGAHFPIDVLSGYLIGALGGWLATKVLTLRSRELPPIVAKLKR